MEPRYSGKSSIESGLAQLCQDLLLSRNSRTSQQIRDVALPDGDLNCHYREHGTGLESIPQGRNVPGVFSQFEPLPRYYPLLAEGPASSHMGHAIVCAWANAIVDHVVEIDEEPVLARAADQTVG